MLKSAQLRIACALCWLTFIVLPLTAAPTLPYCTNDCALAPQAPATHGVGRGGWAASATAASSAAMHATLTNRRRCNGRDAARQRVTQRAMCAPGLRGVGIEIRAPVLQILAAALDVMIARLASR